MMDVEHTKAAASTVLSPGSEIRSQATPARDELSEAELIDAIAAKLEGWPFRKHAGAAAVEVMKSQGWSKPRTVNSAAELDALPVGSLIRAVEREGLKFGSVYEKTRHEWLHLDPADRDDGDCTLPSGAIVHCHTGGITVLFVPGDAG